MLKNYMLMLLMILFTLSKVVTKTYNAHKRHLSF